tara:strand:- start:148 stop:336 length:189 start_codon:yes stop_codon:yes gene_type:complete
MIKDFIIYGMRFKRNGNQILRIEKSLVVDTWTISGDNKNIEKIVLDRMIENHFLYKDILKTL